MATRFSSVVASETCELKPVPVSTLQVMRAVTFACTRAMHRAPKGAAQRDVSTTPGQSRYTKALHSDRPVVVAIGPAGTGKTMLACREAQRQYTEGLVGRILVTRPIRGVSGEDCGFLPGDIDSKFAPWMIPVFDCFPSAAVSRHVEVAPLGFMRGRTLSDCFVVCDEMQNATTDQIKMLLTRIGRGTKVVLTGDLDQTDIEEDSGLADLVQRMRTAESLQHLELVELDECDIHRHPVVNEVLSLYRKQ